MIFLGAVAPVSLFVASICSVEEAELFFLCIYIAVVPGILGICVILIIVISMLITRRWRQAAYVTLYTGTFVTSLILSSLTGMNLTRHGVDDKLRLRLYMRQYQEDLAKTPIVDGIKMRSWSWGATGLAITANDTYTLFYDSSDQLDRPPSDRSEGWLRLAGQSVTNVDIYRAAKHQNPYVRNLGGHFYSIEEER